MKESEFGSAIRLIEDALVLLKRADASAWLIYVAGIAPFFALLLFEATDLAQNPFALQHLLFVAFALALLYLWLHVLQSLFCGRLHAILTETRARIPHQFASACAIQPILAASKLIFWPLALAVCIPYPAAAMFYQHSLVPQSPRASSAALRSAINESKSDTAYRRAQSVWVVLLVFLLRAILWFNLLFLLWVMPSLLKTMTGFEGRLTRSPELLLNPTALIALCVLAYIGLDPVVKACCVLRRFARQSETSGLDLRLRLSVLQRVAPAVLICVALVCIVCAPLPLRAAQLPQTAAVSPERMQRAIDEVFHDPRGAWDLPVIEDRKPASNPFFAFMDSLADRLNSLWQSIDSAINDVLKALQRIFSNNQRDLERKARPVSKTAGWIVIGCFSLFLAAVLFVAFWKRKRRLTLRLAPTSALPSKPVDIVREDTSPLDQPADEWLKLAAQYRAGGNLRFAVRALYLATLAALGRNGLISLARGKSNLDYFRELERRARRLDPEFVPTFRANLGLFEASWYGAHPVTEETLAAFEHNSSLLRASV